MTQIISKRINNILKDWLIDHETGAPDERRTKESAAEKIRLWLISKDSILDLSQFHLLTLPDLSIDTQRVIILPGTQEHLILEPKTNLEKFYILYNQKKLEELLNNWIDNAPAHSKEREHRAIAASKIVNCHKDILMPLDLSGLQLTELPPLSLICHLKKLILSNNQLTRLDLTGLINLTHLKLENNQLTHLDLTGLKKLEVVIASHNKLTNITLTNLASLSRLELENNQLTHLDLTGLKKLEIVIASHNKLTNITLTNLASLSRLELENNQLTHLDLTGLKKLEIVIASHNKLTNITLTGLINLTHLELVNNELTALNLGNLFNLKKVAFSDNLIESLTLTGLSELEYLNASNNALVQINLTDLAKIERLYLSENNLTTIIMQNPLRYLKSLFLNENRTLETLPVQTLSKSPFLTELETTETAIDPNVIQIILINCHTLNIFLYQLNNYG